jgi:hypothetical protein
MLHLIPTLLQLARTLPFPEQLYSLCFSTSVACKPKGTAHAAFSRYPQISLSRPEGALTLARNSTTLALNQTSAVYLYSTLAVTVNNLNVYLDLAAVAKQARQGAYLRACGRSVHLLLCASHSSSPKSHPLSHKKASLETTVHATWKHPHHTHTFRESSVRTGLNERSLRPG